MNEAVPLALVKVLMEIAGVVEGLMIETEAPASGCEPESTVEIVSVPHGGVHAISMPEGGSKRETSVMCLVPVRVVHATSTFTTLKSDVMLLESDAPVPSLGSSAYSISVRRVKGMPLSVTISDCAIEPDGMPPDVPIAEYVRLRMYSRRSFASAIALPRALLLVTTSTERMNAAAMPRKITSMSAVPTIVSSNVAPRFGIPYSVFSIPRMKFFMRYTVYVIRYTH